MSIENTFSLPRNDNVHYLRGIASLLVLLGHAAIYFGKVTGDSTWKSVFPDELGIFGVALFFAISGYLMASLIQLQDPFDFICKRFLRIYPVFLIASAIALLIASPAALNLWHPLSITLAPNQLGGYILAIEWTLVNEVFFYCVLFVLAVCSLQRFVGVLAVAWLLAIVTAVVFHWTAPKIGLADLSEIFLMNANAGFAAGLLIPPLAKRVKLPLVFFAVFLVSIPITQFVPPQWVRIVAGLGASSLLVAALQTPISLPRLVDIVLSRLGDWSYALYLIHVTVLIRVYRTASEVLPDSTHWFWLGVLGAIAASSLLGSLDLLIHRQTKNGLAVLSTDAKKRLGIGLFALWLFCSIYALTLSQS